MRKIMVLALSAMMMASGAGCVVAMGNRGTLKGLHTGRYPVAVDGQVYLVNASEGTMCKVPVVDAPCRAEPPVADVR
jgi:hypothetical protein